MDVKIPQTSGETRNSTATLLNSIKTICVNTLQFLRFLFNEAETGETLFRG